MKLYPDPDEDVELDDDEDPPLVIPWRKPPPYVCSHCQDDNCGKCIDILRTRHHMATICYCRRKKHRQEESSEDVPTVQADS